MILAPVFSGNELTDLGCDRCLLTCVDSSQISFLLMPDNRPEYCRSLDPKVRGTLSDHTLSLAINTAVAPVRYPSFSQMNSEKWSVIQFCMDVLGGNGWPNDYEGWPKT